MISILGFIGFVITLLVIVPASLTALIRVLSHPVKEITYLWLNLIDQVIDIFETIKRDFIRKE